MKKLIRKIKMSVIPMIIAQINLITSKVFAGSEFEIPISIEPTCYVAPYEPSVTETIGKWAIVLLPILFLIAIVVIVIKKFKKKKTVEQKVEEVKDKIKESDGADIPIDVTCYSVQMQPISNETKKIGSEHKEESEDNKKDN